METIDTGKDSQGMNDMSKQIANMMNSSNAIPTIRNFTGQGIASPEMIQHLMKKIDMVLEGGQLMQAAIQCSKADLVQLYIEKGCRIDNPPSNIATQINGGKVDSYRQTPYIIQAACHGDIDVFQTLLKADANIFDIGHVCLSRKKKNSVESNCIGAAAYYGNNKILKLSLQKMSRQYHSVGAREKIDPKATKTTYLSQEFMGYSPLMLSVAGPHANLECVKTLLNAQADFRTIDKMGNSILHIAALNSQNTILDYLTKNLRMDIFARNTNGETALFICKSLKNQDGVVMLEKFQQFDQSRDKTKDLLKELEDQERKEELAKQKKKEKKHRSKIQKLAKEQGVSVEELTKKFEDDETQRLIDEKRRQEEEAEAEVREEQMIREQKQLRIQWEIERKREQERQQAEERRQQILEERKREQEIQKQKDESRAAYQAKRQAERDARRKEQKQSQENNKDGEERETPAPAQEKKQKKQYADKKKDENKDGQNKQEVTEEGHENAQDDEEVSGDENANVTPQDKKKTTGPVIEGLVGDAALNAMGKRAKKRYLEQKKKEEEEAAALKEAILLKKKQQEQEQRDAIKQKKQEDKDQAKQLKDQAKQLKDQEKEQKKQAAEESKKQKLEAKKPLKEQKNKENEVNQEQTNQEKKWKVKQAQPATETVETPIEPENQNSQAVQKVYKKKEKAQSNDKQKKSAKATTEEKKPSVVNTEVVTPQQPEETKQVVEKQQEASDVKQEAVKESVSSAQKSSKKDSRHEVTLQQKIKDLESQLIEKNEELNQVNQQNQQLNQKCDQLQQENVNHQEMLSKFNQSQQQFDDVQVDLEDANQLKQQVKTLQTQLLRQNHVNKNLSSQLLETEKKVTEEKKKRTEFETHFEKVINVTQRQKAQDDASVARESNDLVSVQNYLTNIKMRMQQSLDSQ